MEESNAEAQPIRASGIINSVFVLRGYVYKVLRYRSWVLRGLET